VSGVVRVFKTGRTGREITLYRIGTGETCILSVNAILTASRFRRLRQWSSGSKRDDSGRGAARLVQRTTSGASSFSN